MSYRRRFRLAKHNVLDFLQERYSKLFFSANEARLIEILGGTVITFGAIRRDGKQLRIVLSQGRLLRSERFRRSALDGQGMLANDIKYAIAIRGKDYERDVVTAYERDEYLKSKGWVVRYIPEAWLYGKEDYVRDSIRQFIYS